MEGLLTAETANGERACSRSVGPDTKLRSGLGGLQDQRGLCLPYLTLADFTDWMQEYRCLLTLEGLQAIVEQCLHRLQELQTGETPPHPYLC